ncbi:30S ribosomal protein S18 [Mycoplasma iguanae]|uniref:Small ribosomal subunit protein bS18 n=1 Tax=Mycoplasma iguanae TaxID=292461 RepID=A0ABY5R9A4_9MOLU|nr:30S ribosomal protein S18 [Mycoplasma iguanae]UVD81752.1 30S ribosomal protein S18 [Mycoplasma iguanae]
MIKKIKKPGRKKPCNFCQEKMDYIDYKKTEIVSRFVNLHGKILPSRVTGTCARHQRLLSTAIKRARFVALIPFVSERIRK